MLYQDNAANLAHDDGFCQHFLAASSLSPDDTVSR
jgi:hypothetical protein